MITVKSYFSGAGGMDYGIASAGLEIIRSYEIDKTCCKTLRMNFKHDIYEEDITKITVLDQPESDVCIATFPCDKYTTIADISHTRTGDDLFLHFLRHIVLLQPEAYVIENVPGMKKFPVVMETLTQLPDYYVRVECPVNTNIWLPQNRERLIIIGTKKPFDNLRYPEAVDPIKLIDIIEEDPEVHIPKYVYNRLNGLYRDKPIISDVLTNDIAPCCVAHYSKDVSTRLVRDKKGNLRPWSKLEYARLQGFNDSFKFAGKGNSAVYRQIGNAVSPYMAEWIGRELKRYFGYV